MIAESGSVVVQRDWPHFTAREDFEDVAPKAQALFLSDAMARLGMDKEQFARRIRVSRKCLGKWMARHGTPEFRTMSPMAWQFIGEIMERAVSPS